MNDKRKTKRVECIYKCVLYHGKIKYLCLLENISIGGALVSLMSKPNAAIHLGDSCCLIIDRNLLDCSSIHTGKVIRRQLSQIGLFFDLGYHRKTYNYNENNSF